MQNGQMVILGFVVLLLFSLQASPATEHDDLFLSSVKPNCHLEKSWFGIVQVLPEAVWLECSGVRFLVTAPNNLVSHVTIHTPAQALEYVRFFTSSNSYRYFDLGGMVELFPGKVTDESDFNIVESNTFYKHFKEATVQEIPPENTSKQSKHGKYFRISRVVVCLDQKIYTVEEFVTETGFYNISSRKIVLEDASELGIFHFGNI